MLVYTIVKEYKNNNRLNYVSLIILLVSLVVLY